MQRQLLPGPGGLGTLPSFTQDCFMTLIIDNTNTQISQMEELEAIAVLGRTEFCILYFASSWRYPDTRAAALRSHKDNVALP